MFLSVGCALPSTPSVTSPAARKPASVCHARVAPQPRIEAAAPVSYGPHKTIYNRFIRWSRMGVFGRILMELAKRGGDTEEIMIDVEPVVRHWSENHWRGHLKAHRTAASLVKKGLFRDFLDAQKAV